MDPLKKQFNLIQCGNWKLFLRPSIAETSFAEFCSVPRTEFPNGMVPVVSSVNTEVRKFVYKGKGYFLKEYFFINWKKHLKILRRGQRLAHIADLMTRDGFLTPRIVGIGRFGKNRRVVSEAVEDARDIWQVLFPQNNEYRGNCGDGFLYSLGLTIGQFHQCGFFHGDLRWRNVLTRQENGNWSFYFIDNDRTKLFRMGIPLRLRIKNLAQILFSGLLYDWPETDWKEFLRGYFDGSVLSEPLRKKLIAKVEKKAGKRFEARKRCEGKK
jgi:tRNA A-37 threonylcarbamoyl transferase component Bud32